MSTGSTAGMPPRRRPAYFDEDEVVAAVDLLVRCGALDVEIGYLHDDVPPELAEWWAQARWRGTKVIAEKHTSPAGAVAALVRRVVHKGTCTHCGRRISLLPGKGGRVCHWTRKGPKWHRGCRHLRAEGARRVEVRRGEFPS